MLKIMTETNRTEPYGTVPAEIFNLKLGTAFKL